MAFAVLEGRQTETQKKWLVRDQVYLTSTQSFTRGTGTHSFGYLPGPTGLGEERGCTL